MIAHGTVPALLADIAVLVLLTCVVGCCATRQDFEDAYAPQRRDQDPQTRKLDNPQKPRVVVEKSARTLTVFDGERVAKKYRICSGLVAGDKECEGDKKTPLGDFYVCYKNPQSKYTLSLGLSYPGVEDADRGLKAKLIDQPQYDAIVAAQKSRATGEQAWLGLWKTKLGGEIMIHGAGADRAGTAGCVGMNDEDICELYAAIPVGTPVTILK